MKIFWCSLVLLSLWSATALAAKNQIKYACMLDAGSTGSRIHVYVMRYTEQSNVPIVEHDHFLEVKPGISSYKDDATQAGPSIQKLIDFAYVHVPVEHRATTTAHLKATAGLRLLPTSTQHALLDSIRTTLSATPFRFQPEWVSVISGVEEAIGAWITVNYLLGKLDQPETVGIADLGGGSVQIACLPSDGPAPKHLSHPVTVGGRTFNLYIKSHLGYGLMQGRLGLQKLAIKNSGGPTAQTVYQPCLPKDHSVTIADQLHVGTGNYLQCKEYAEEWMRNGGTDLPLLKEMGVQTRGKFLAFSYFFDVLPSFGLSQEPTLKEVDMKAEEVCAMESKAVVEAYPHHTSKHDFTDHHSCSDLVYIAALLRHLVRLDDNEKRMTLGKQIDGKELSWTLGATLAVMGEIDAEEAQAASMRFWIAIGVVVVLSLIMTAIIRPSIASKAGAKGKRVNKKKE